MTTTPPDPIGHILAQNRALAAAISGYQPTGLFAELDSEELDSEALDRFGDVPDLDDEGLRLLIDLHAWLNGETVAASAGQPRDSKGRFVSTGAFSGMSGAELRGEAKKRFGSTLPKIKDETQLRNLVDLHHQMAGSPVAKAAKVKRAAKTADPAKVAALHSEFQAAREQAHAGKWSGQVTQRESFSKASKSELDGVMKQLGFPITKTKKAAVERLMNTLSISSTSAWRR